MRDRFHSRCLGSAIAIEDVRLLDYDQARVVADEVADELRSAKAHLEDHWARKRAGEHVNQSSGALIRRRSFLAQLHQTVLRRKADTRPEPPAESTGQFVMPEVPAEAEFFVQAARNSLDAATFQRLTLIAAQRRAAELSRLSGLPIDPDHLAA